MIFVLFKAVKVLRSAILGYILLLADTISEWEGKLNVESLQLKINAQIASHLVLKWVLFQTSTFYGRTRSIASISVLIIYYGPCGWRLFSADHKQRKQTVKDFAKGEEKRSSTPQYQKQVRERDKGSHSSHQNRLVLVKARSDVRRLVTVFLGRIRNAASWMW